MRVPQKVKTLLWQACHDAMPTKQSLFRHTIIEDRCVTNVMLIHKTLYMRYGRVLSLNRCRPIQSYATFKGQYIF